MPTFTNIRGTSEPQFRISLSGPTTYHGTGAPGVGTPPSSEIYDELHEGDIYILHNGTSSSMYQYIGPTDTDWVEFLVTGGTAPTITSDLSVHGQFDTYDNLITLNSQPSALVDNIGGMEVLRISGGSETVQWVWNDSNSYWEPSTDASTPNTGLHNVHVENNLTVGGTVGGRLTAPDGLAATPGIRFSTAGVGIYATSTTLGFSTGSTSRWLIDATGNLLPAAAQDIGATGALAGNIYGTLFAGVDGAVGTPTFTFDSDLTTGIYHDVGAIVLSSGGTEVARVDATEMELQGTLKITDGTSWTIDNDGADSNKLKFAYSAVDEVVITTSGEILIGDGSQANPAYSFLSDDTIGMYWDGTDIRFTVALGSDHLVISPTAITAPTAVPVNPKDLTTKEYVDAATGGSWREPVIVKDDAVYTDLTNAEGSMNTGSVDGIPVTGGDRILYTAISGEPKNIFIINGTPGAGATLVEDTNTVSHGDTVYVNEGTNENNVYSYNVNNEWSEISATSGFGGTLYFNYEVQTTGAAQTTFTLAGIKYAPTSDGARLLVYINGVKQVFTDAYSETNETTVEFVVAPGAGKTIEFYGVGLATDDGILKQEEQTGLSGTPLITFTTITYVTTQDGLLVFLNGQKMIADTHYTEVSSTTIQWITPSLVTGDVLEFYSSVPIVAGVNLEDISNVSTSTPDDQDVLAYSTTTGAWEPVAPGTAGVGMLYDDDLAGLTGAIDGVNTVFQTTDVTVQSKTGGPGKRSYQLVYVNGVLQKEDSTSGDYVVAFPNLITFNAGSIPQTGDTIDVYQL